MSANKAIQEFGSPALLDATKPDEILQIGVAPNRIDIIQSIESIAFNTAWKRRIEGR